MENSFNSEIVDVLRAKSKEINYVLDRYKEKIKAEYKQDAKLKTTTLMELILILTTLDTLKAEIHSSLKVIQELTTIFAEKEIRP